MDIQKLEQGSEVVLKFIGRMDSSTSPAAEEAAVKEKEAEVLVFDLSELSYISSAGLRVILSAQKRQMAAKHQLIVRGAGETVMEIFEVTGFKDILTLE